VKGRSSGAQQAEVYLALVLGLADAVEQYPRRDAVTGAWAGRQRELCTQRTREALAEVNEEIGALQRLRDILDRRLEQPLRPGPDHEE
jgi:hypothetical protein